MSDMENSNLGKVKIKVVGVGGAGGNAVNDMIESGIHGVEFIAANTDAQDLAKSKAPIKIQLGEKLTKGLGAGANPIIGKQAVEEDKEKIKHLLEDTDMLFITAGMGGGTGTGAAPVISKIAKDMGILTVAVVTKPFKFEGKKRKENAEVGIEEMKTGVDTLIVIPNDKLFELPEKQITLKNAFEEANDILKIGIKGIAELITEEGFINLDFADVSTIMTGAGVAMLGFGEAHGTENRAATATEQALASPLLEKSIKGARKILLNVTGGYDMGLNEAQDIANMITEAAGENTTEVIFGAIMKEEMEDMLKITVIATDFIDENVNQKLNKEVKNFKSRNNESKDKSEIDDFDLELDIPTFIRRVKK